VCRRQAATVPEEERVSDTVLQPGWCRRRGEKGNIGSKRKSKSKEGEKRQKRIYEHSTFLSILSKLENRSLNTLSVSKYLSLLIFFTTLISYLI
jgi:hypothetical protein